MENVSFEDPQAQGESFSFSGCDFNSPKYSGAFFDDEDLDDDESYIEIALEHWHPKRDDDDDDDDDGESTDQDLEFRISFSSACCHGQSLNIDLASKIPESLETESSSSPSSSATTLTASTAATTCSPSELISSPPKINNNYNVSNTRALSSLRAFSSSSSSEEIEYCRPHQTRQLAFRTGIRDWELLRSRKVAKATTAINGGIMKFFIKLRSIKIRTMLMIKPRQVLSAQHSNRRPQKTLWNYRRLIKAFNKSSAQRDPGNTSNNDVDSSFGNAEKSRVLDVNLDAIRKVLEAMSISIGRKDKLMTKSCPSSIKSSPIQRGVPDESKIFMGDNSVQAAIAHCKRSFGQTSEFCFQTPPSNLNENL